MADHGTAIEWTQAPGFKGETWNPVTGCDRVSPGCAHCYALELAGRLKGMGQKRYQRDGDPKTSGPGFGLTLHPDKLEEPLRWRKPRMVFVNSMSDLFHEAIPTEFIARVFATMAAAPQHVFQVLTKRPERMLDLLGAEGDEFTYWWRQYQPETSFEWPLPNVWLGVTIENRRFVHRADLLRETPAAVRFISAEPLLGPLVPTAPAYADFKATWIVGGGRVEEADHPALDLSRIDWLIAGGESGPNHRPVDPQWIRDLRDACLRQQDNILPGTGPTDTAFFFKQWGGSTAKAGGRELDGRTWSEFPAALSTSQRAA